MLKEVVSLLEKKLYDVEKHHDDLINVEEFKVYKGDMPLYHYKQTKSFNWRISEFYHKNNFEPGEWTKFKNDGKPSWSAYEIIKNLMKRGEEITNVEIIK